MVQQLFRQGLHGQARSAAATGKMFPRLVYLQLEVCFIFSLVISPAVTFGGDCGRIRPAQVVLTLGAIEQVRVPGTAVQDQFSHRSTALGNRTVG